MSSLETLLEAAKFVECTDTTENSARAPDPPEFHHYAKSAPIGSRLKRSNSGSDKSDTNDDGRDRKRHASAGTREVHNKLEKNRRAHLKECFDNLKQQIPNLENHNKVSNLSILRGAYRYIQMLKKREVELEQEMHELACNKITVQVKLTVLQKELSDMNIDVDISHFLPLHDEDTRSVSTATADNESPIMSEDEEAVMHRDQIQAQPSNRQLSFCNVIVTPPAKPAPLAVPSRPVQSVAHQTPMVKPVLTLPIKTLGSAIKASPSIGNATSNNRTIAAMLNTSGQSLLCDNLGTAKLNASLSDSVLAKTSTMTTPHPVSLYSLSSGSLSLMSLPIQANTAPAVTTMAALSQPHQQTISAKIPVTQILQKTIAQRVQLQQLQKLQQQLQQPSQQQQPTATLVVGTTGTTVTPSIGVNQVSGTMPQVFTMNASALRPVMSALKTIPQIRPAVALNHVLPSAITLNAQSLLANSATATTSTSTFINSQPIVAATLNRPTSNTLATTTLTLSTTRNANLINQLSGLTTTASTPSLAGVPNINLTAVKPILTLPITQIPTAQLVSQQVTTLQQLMSQAAAHKMSTQVQVHGTLPSSSTAVAAGDSMTGPAILSPAISVTQVSPAAGLAQFLPINMVSPGAAQATTLNQANITSTALNAQVLKSLGLPILQQPFSLPIKPIVMVSMPGGATTPGVAAVSATPTTPTIHVNLPVSRS